MFQRLFAACLVIASWALPTYADFNYANFQNPQQLRFNGEAAATDGRARITKSTWGLLSGSMWHSDKQDIHGFSTTFQFQISSPDATFDGGDGFAFVIQNSSVAALGGPGAAMGYGNFQPTGIVGIPDCLAVEFDTFHNVVNPGDLDTYVDEPNGNHISIQSRGALPNYYDKTASLGYTTAIGNLSDGAVHTAKIVYGCGTMQIYLDDMNTSVLTRNLNLSDYIGSQTAWVGFTAAGAAAYENHDILSWSYASTPEPSSLAALLAGIGGLFGIMRKKR